jgi:hypothetical protein
MNGVITIRATVIALGVLSRFSLTNLVVGTATTATTGGSNEWVAAPLSRSSSRLNELQKI